MKKEDKNLVADVFDIGDLVKGEFNNTFVFTFSMASETHQGSLQGDGPQFHKDEIGLVIDIISTPESFYSMSFCKLLLNSGETGWLPSRWLIKADYDTK